MHDGIRACGIVLAILAGFAQGQALKTQPSGRGGTSDLRASAREAIDASLRSAASNARNAVDLLANEVTNPYAIPDDDRSTPPVSVRPAQYQSSPLYRGVDGLVGPGTRRAATDPAAGDAPRRSSPAPDLAPIPRSRTSQTSSPTGLYGASLSTGSTAQGNASAEYTPPANAQQYLRQRERERAYAVDPRTPSASLTPNPQEGSASASSQYAAPRQRGYLPPSGYRSDNEGGTIERPNPNTSPSPTPPAARTLAEGRRTTVPSSYSGNETSLPGTDGTSARRELAPPPNGSLGLANQGTPPASENDASYELTGNRGLRTELSPSAGGSYFMTLLALFASVGLNLYLGWIAWDTYNRYQDLVADMRHSSRRDRGDRRTTEPY